MNEDKVIHLADQSHGFSTPDLRKWAHEWIDELASGEYPVRSMVIMVEDNDGQMFKVSQSLVRLDGLRVVGMLQALQLALLEGRGGYEDLVEEYGDAK